VIQGQLTALRAIEEADLPQLLTWRNQPELRRYFREHRELNSTQQRQWFEAKVNGDPGTRMFAITRRIDAVNRTADFSIYLGADGLYIDSQLAPDAAITMTRYAFDELGLNRLWSEIYAFDSAKTEFFQRLGFALDGRHRQTHWAEGAWHDSLYFSLLASDRQPVYPSQPLRSTEP
jgi:RimJ/RimL family protein N-acetyltransferase